MSDELKFETFHVNEIRDIQGVALISEFSDDANGEAITEWLNELGWQAYHEVRGTPGFKDFHEEIRVVTPHGTSVIKPGDWVMELPWGDISVLPESVVWAKFSK